MSFQDHFEKSLRLATLRLLDEAPGSSANTSVLHCSIQDLAFIISRDKLEGEVAWLKEQGFVTVEVLGRVNIVTLTKRGHAIITGAASHPGIQRPSLGD